MERNARGHRLIQSAANPVIKRAKSLREKKHRKAAGQLQDVVIIHPGTNGTAYWDMLKNTLDGLRDLLHDVRQRTFRSGQGIDPGVDPIHR